MVGLHRVGFFNQLDFYDRKTLDKKRATQKKKSTFRNKDYFVPSYLRKKIGVKVSSKINKIDFTVTNQLETVLINKATSEKVLGAFIILKSLGHLIYVDLKEHYLIDPNGVLVCFPSSNTLYSFLQTSIQTLYPIINNVDVVLLRK